MAGSMGNRHQPDHSEQEPGQEYPSGLRPRQRRHRPKPPPLQEIKPTPLPLNQRRQRLSRLHLPTRNSPELEKPLLVRSRLQPVSSSRSQLGRSQLGLGINPRLSKLRAAGSKPLQPQSNSDRQIKGNRNSISEPNAMPELKPLSAGRKRRQELKREPFPAARATQVIPNRPNPTRRDAQFAKEPSSPTQKNKRKGRSQKRAFRPLVYIIRLLILGIGIGAIAGTLFSAFDPASQLPVNANDSVASPAIDRPNQVNQMTPMVLKEEIAVLKTQFQTLATPNAKLQPGVFLVDLDTGGYVDLQGESSFPAASMIKVPILVAFFQDVDAGKIKLDEPLTLEPDVIATGSGELQYQKPGRQYTALEVATKMSAISDNTATNMIIKRLGGVQALNQRFQSWGLTATTINNLLPDLTGTNVSTPKDLANVMSMVNQGQLLSVRSRDRLLNIMQATVNNSLIPKGLGPGATIAHKTGDIGSLVGDVGLVDMPNGKRYILVAMVKRPHNDGSASELIRNISRTVYNYFKQPSATPIKQNGSAGVS